MTAAKKKVWVVDDEPQVLEGLSLLLRSYGYVVEPCCSGEELLERCEPDAPGCILLDLRMPGLNGIEVQGELKRRGCRQPVVFLSGHGDIPVAVNAIQAGAIDFLEKPIRGEQLVDVLERAMKVGRLRKESADELEKARELLAALSRREAEVADLLALGLRSREIALRLRLSPRTVEMHRTRLLKRLGARTAAEAADVIARARRLLSEKS